MIDALIFLGLGIISGICSSVPIGPTNLWVAKAVLPPARTRSAIAAFVAGIVFFDVLYAALAFWGYSKYLQGTWLEQWLGYAVSLILIGYGIAEWISIKKAPSTLKEANAADTHQAAQKRSALLPCLGLGLLFGSNPGFMAFWLTLADLLEGWQPASLQTLTSLPFYPGIIFGDILWYGGLVIAIHKGLSWISDKGITWVRKIIALGFIALGSFSFVKLVLN